MGSAGSKSKTPSSSSSSSSSSSGRRRVRSKAHRVLQSSCLGTTSNSRSHSLNQIHQHQLLVSDNRNNKENATNAPSHDEMPKIECCNNNNSRKVKIGQHSDEMPSNIARTASTIGTSAARPPSAQSLNPSGGHWASSCVARDGISGSGIDGNMCSPRNLTEMENVSVRVPDRNAGAREPIERNVCFSRTLSLGRLHDRVLHQSSLSHITFIPIQQQQQQQQQVDEVRGTDQVSVGQGCEDQTRTLASESSAVASPSSSAYPSSSMPNSLFSIQDYEVETSRSRDTQYHDLLEHRSNFLERRRRTRSQVHALQRLGSHFENLSGHERACILSGQHRTGRSTCRMSNRDPRLNDDTSARASISRIVMLAEALFEVLDEIHQQSMVLSSGPSVSSIGSVPARSDFVESLPVKLYSKLQKHQNEEVAQCYICLVEYEEGERMRLLPCHHEFHKTCVDKWLKEIHRVCPLCRGDICRSGSLPSED